MVAFHKVIFYEVKEPERYDPSLGRIVTPEAQKLEKSCYVYDLSTSLKLELYGRANVKALTLYHQGKVIDRADRLEVLVGPFRGKYQITSRRQLMGKASYIVSEVKLA